MPRRSKLRNDVVSVTDQDDLTGPSKANILGETSLQLLDPNGLHEIMVVTGSHNVKRCERDQGQGNFGSLTQQAGRLPTPGRQ